LHGSDRLRAVGYLKWSAAYITERHHWEASHVAGRLSTSLLIDTAYGAFTTGGRGPILR
jgi:hypothetical protein